MLTKTRAQAQQARSALERGATWKQVARRYSIDESSGRRGGRLPAQAEGTLDEAARPRRASAPATDGWSARSRPEYGYYVVQGHPGHAGVGDAGQAEHRKLVREHLMSEAEQQALTTFVTAFTATWKARTVCAPAYDWVTDCSNWDGTEVKP